MKVYYNSDSINNCTDDNSIFAHRDVSETHEERVRIKNAVLETVMDSSGVTFGKREKEYWLLHRQGMKNKEIAEKLGITQSTCRNFKFKVSKKINKIAKKLKERLDKNM